MAFGSRNRCQLVVSNVDLDGKLNPQSYCQLTIEILKYAIFTRGQIPLQYDFWCRDLNAVKNTDVLGVLQRNTRRKNEETVTNFEKWFEEIRSLFINRVDVQEILFVIGATYISPKIVYKIKLPGNLWAKNVACDFLPMRMCLLQVLKQLVKAEEAVAVVEIAPTNMYLFVKMNSNCGVNSLIPKPDFQPLQRGICVNINLNEKEQLSQFQVFNDSLQNSTDNCIKMAEKLSELQLNEKINSHFIWFQSPITVKGIRN